MSGLALSSVWRSLQYRAADHLMRELLSSGLSQFELEYRVEKDTLDGLLRLMETGDFTVGSLHNFCPHPETKPWEEASGDCFNLASGDHEERRLAVEYTKRTIDYARRFRASTVVLHLGSVDMDKQRVMFWKILDCEAVASTWAQSFLAEFLAERKAQSAKKLELLWMSIDAILPYAERYGIRLGIENRYFLSQIPDFEEFHLLLERYPSSRLGYWHDVGHAQVHANLGLAGNLEYLKAFSMRLFGAHIHDCQGRLDHRAPGTGMVDYLALAPYLRQAPLKVLEVKQRVTGDEITAGMEKLKQAGILSTDPEEIKNQALST